MVSTGAPVVGGKGASLNLQFARIKSAVCKAVENDAVNARLCDSEVTTGNGGSVPVKNNSLGYVGETTAVDLQFAAVVILYGIQAAGEAAAVDGERGICCIGSKDISRGSIARCYSSDSRFQSCWRNDRSVPQ